MNSAFSILWAVKKGGLVTQRHNKVCDNKVCDALGAIVYREIVRGHHCAGSR